MCKQLLISDANIIIDIVAGELTAAMFALNYQFAVPDILYADELEAQHSAMLAQGLRLIELRPESVSAADNYYANNKASRVSANDCMALSLAQQEDCYLLTGDAKLKQLATTEGVTVYGTLWLVEQMLTQEHINVGQAEVAYQKMIEDGSRLPENDIKKQLKKFGLQS